MSKFRKKPVVIEAVRISSLTGESFLQRAQEWPIWAAAAFDSNVMQVGEHSVLIRTPEGDMVGSVDDWLIRGVKGVPYPCPPDIFEVTYELVE